MDLKSLTAIIVALIALITSVIQLWMGKRNAAKLESLKANIDLNKKYHEEFLKTFSEAIFERQHNELDFLKEYLKQIQLFKDFIRGVVTSPGKYSSKVTVEKAKEMSDDIITLYSTSLFFMEHNIQQQSHSIKHLILGILYQVGDIFIVNNQNIIIEINRKLDALSIEQTNLLNLGKDKIEIMHEKIKLITHGKLY